MIEIILDSMLRLDKISITLVLLSFSFRKLQVSQCFKSCKNARNLFLIMFTKESPKLILLTPIYVILAELHLSLLKL